MTVYDGGLGALALQGLRIPSMFLGACESRGHEDLLRVGALLVGKDRNKPRDSYINVSKYMKLPQKILVLWRHLVSVLEKLGGVKVYRAALYLALPAGFRQHFGHMIR